MVWIMLLGIVGTTVAQHDWTNTPKLQKFPVFSVVATKDVGVSTDIGITHKYEGNPLWNQDRAWEPRLDNGYPNVIHDPSDPLGEWRMWYGASLWEYATSSDGIKWNKPDLGIFDLGAWDGKWAKYGKHNNVIMHCEGCGIYKDAHEPDPLKRFKMFGGPACPFDKGGGPADCTGPIQGTAVSPDGLWWHEARNITWPYSAGCPDCPNHHKYDTHQNLFWDNTKKKYIATTRDLTPFPWRAVGIAESYTNELDFDLTNEPTAVVQGTAAEQPYSQITFPYYGIYLGLTSVYDATEGPTEAERVHLRLSWSSDALQWHWVDKGGLTGKDFIALGGSGLDPPAHPSAPFDSHIIFAAAYPIKMPDASVRVYYMGGNGQHSGPRNSSFGLATMRADGFVSEAGTGTIITRPLRCTGAVLVVSADVALGGSVRIGVAGSGSSAQGLSPTDAELVVTNVTDHTVMFSSKKTFATLVGMDVALELVLDRAAVFTVGFKNV